MVKILSPRTVHQIMNLFPNCSSARSLTAWLLIAIAEFLPYLGKREPAIIADSPGHFFSTSWTFHTNHRHLFTKLICRCLFDIHQSQRISLSSSMISASVFSSTKREISSIRLSAIALCGTIAATPITMI